MDMKALLKSPNTLLIALSVILGQLTWPLTGLPVLLGPTLLLGAEPLITLSLSQYLLAAIISASLSTLLTNSWLGLIILLQFLLWYFAHGKRNIHWWLLTTLLPIGLLAALQTEKTYLVYLSALGSAICQTLLYRGLMAVAKHRIKQLKEQHRHRQGADRLSAAINQAHQLEKLPGLTQALNETMEQTYEVYQDLELLARATPRIPQPLIQNLLSAAQRTHQLRLQLQDWYHQQGQLLADWVGYDTMSLKALFTWVSLLVRDLAEKGGQQLETFIDLEEDAWLTKTQQLPLGILLLYICRQGLGKLTESQLQLRFSGYVASEGLRLIITMAPNLQTVSGEWPRLHPYDLSPVEEYVQKLNAICLTGVTTLGEQIYTLELT